MQADIPTPAGHAVVAKFDAALIAVAALHSRMVFPDGSTYEQFTREDGTGQVVRTVAP
jgi:hypothetical protein